MYLHFSEQDRLRILEYLKAHKPLIDAIELWAKEMKES